MRPLNPHCLALGVLFEIAMPATWMQRQGAIQGRSTFEYSLLFFHLKLKLRRREKNKEERAESSELKEPLRVILQENKGEWRMTKGGARGKFQRQS